MDSKTLSLDPAFQDLTAKMTRFLDGIESDATVEDAEAMLKRLGQLPDAAAQGAKPDLGILREVLELIGMKRAVFEKAATAIHAAAHDLLKSQPELRTMAPDGLKALYFEAHGFSPDAIAFVAKQSNVPEDMTKQAVYGGNPPQFELSELERCRIECNLATGMAFGEALADALSRAGWCFALATAGIAGAGVGAMILAFICLAIVGAAYVVAAKKAQEAAEYCWELCH